MLVMKRGPRSWQRERERGVAAVEFALVAPVLFALLFGIVTFGYVFSQQLALNNAVRQAARAAVVVGNVSQQQCSQMQASVESALSGSTVTNAASVTVTSERWDASTTPNEFNDPDGVPEFSCTPETASTKLCSNSFNSSGPASGAFDSVLIRGNYAADLLLPLPGLGSTIDLSATAIYRCEFDDQT